MSADNALSALHQRFHTELLRTTAAPASLTTTRPIIGRHTGDDGLPTLAEAEERKAPTLSEQVLDDVRDGRPTPRPKPVGGSGAAGRAATSEEVEVVCDHPYGISWIHRTAGRGPVASVSTDLVAKKDRLAWWAHMSAHEIVPTSLSTGHAHDFHGRAYSMDLTAVRVAEFTMSPLKGRRTPAHIRRHDPDGYQLVLIHDGPLRLEQRRNDSVLDFGDIALIDTSQPFVTDFADVGKLSRLTLMYLPRQALPLPRGKVEELLARKLPARTGTGAMLARFLTGLREHAAGCHAAELPRLGAIGIDLVSAFLATHLATKSHLPAESHRRLLAARIDAFIDQHLGDPELGPAAIAAHHHISVRSLHVLFEQQPHTVSATIRRRRLERCHADLADPRLSDLPIGEIAVRWGFRTTAEFSRAFRTAYAMSPRDHRRQSLTENGAVLALHLASRAGGH
ncbi:helix-turn-helix domain-containing protein [Nonomuraea sp. NPDC050202]|uniref:AraC-like ligand-binding domain-containing protein n=1 Tax=Nonomuraea sp. NPDC050202 TaxID=3155035 RepID=UPI003400133B